MKTLGGTILAMMLVCLLASGGFAVIINEDFSSDPGWLSLNTVTSNMNYGYSALTNYAGGAVGEAGGTIARATGLRSYYADDLNGAFTFNNAFEMNWSSANAASVYRDNMGSSNNDAAFLGFFRRDYWTPYGNSESLFMGIVQDGNDLYMAGLFKWSSSRYILMKTGLPNQSIFSVRFKYDPNQGSYGAMTAQYNSETPFVYNLTQTERNLEGGVDTFGLALTDGGDGAGTSQQKFYIDNLAYTSNAVVPEPSSLLALIAGISGLGRLALRRRK